MIATSPDGQWAAVKRGRELMLWAGGGGPATARIELPTDDADLVMVGPPSVLAVVTRGPAAGGGEPCHRVVLYQPPDLDPAARHDLDTAMRIAGLTGSRLVLVSLDGKAVTIVRIAGRALAAQAIDPGSPVEFAVGLERNQVLFSLLRKLETWDAVSGRPLLRMQLPLPPPPRTVGPAHGFVWATRPGGDDILVCRLSDGRPFRHALGVPIDEVIFHPASPLLILVTARGLFRLHCYAHSLTVIDAPWRPGTALGQLVVGEDISLLGITEHDAEPWRVPISGPGAPAIALERSEMGGGDPAGSAGGAGGKAPRGIERSEMGGGDPAGSAGGERTERADRPERADRIDRVGGLRINLADRSDPVSRGERSERPERRDRGDGIDLADRGDRTARDDRADAAPGRPPMRPAMALRAGEPRGQAWRDPLAAFGAELARGADAELPEVAADTDLGELAHRLALPATARRALVALYSLYLVGEPAVSLARLARALGDWTEPLGQGELGALAMLRRRGGKVALRGSVTDLLDGVGPRAIRMIGTAAAVPRPGAARLARDGRSDAAIETELASRLGRIAVIEGGTALALLEARLHGATAVAFVPPRTRPLPWPRDAGLVVVAEPAAPAWVAALPILTAA